VNLDPDIHSTFLELQQQGKLVAGIDEVARGCIFGPVVTACVVLKSGFFDVRIDDSQKLNQPRRKELSEVIKQNALYYAIGEGSVDEINKINILNATLLSMKRTVESLPISLDLLYVDGHLSIPNLSCQQIPVIKGDQKVFVVACASILAKNYTDELMKQLAQQYPEYDLEHSKGYGTTKHLEAIRKFGVTSLHRIHYKTVQSIIKSHVNNL
jgi:ribonuclease HII